MDQQIIKISIEQFKDIEEIMHILMNNTICAFYIVTIYLNITSNTILSIYIIYTYIILYVAAFAYYMKNICSNNNNNNNKKYIKYNICSNLHIYNNHLICLLFIICIDKKRRNFYRQKCIYFYWYMQKSVTRRI